MTQNRGADENCKKQIRIALIEPFFTGSHARWSTELKQRSRHDIDIFSLPGRHWKWRMHGGAVTLAKQFLSSKNDYDLILASDMLDLSVFLALTREKSSKTPVAIYFHENQLCYPWSPRDGDRQKGRDLHYAFINYSSALAANRLLFNSEYHKGAFLEALPEFLDKYPDFNNKSTIERIADKSEVLHLAMDLNRLDELRPPHKTPKEKPLLLWNHRWEYDKNPIGFFRALYGLVDQGIEFELALLGEHFEEEPPYFREAKEKLGSRIIQYGRVEKFEDYACWLWKADILPVTSKQDFFGGSVVEAIYCGCWPLLPNRLAYPDHIDSELYPEFYYTDVELNSKIAKLIESRRWREPCPLRMEVAKYDWENQIKMYDERFLDP